jgi:hypothetical protein
VSDEIAIEPELLERWRGGSVSTRAATDDQPSRRPSERGLAEVVPIRRGLDRATSDPPPPTPRAPIPRDPLLDEIAHLLAAPNGSIAPDFPEVTAIEHTGIRDRQLAAVLEDALASLDVSWD